MISDPVGRPHAPTRLGAATQVPAPPGALTRRLVRSRSSAWAPTPAPASAAPRANRVLLGLAAATLAAGGLSLLIPSTPSYDPWSWTLWAREIIHGHLVITATGTSWKPLPMIFTIPFALFGGAAADLWLVVSRAGLLAALALAFRLVHRLVAGLDADTPDTPGVRRRRHGAGLLGGLFAVVGLGLAPSGFASSSALGYSEGLATALLLAAVELHLDRRPRAAFALGCLVALDRPEVWLLWVPYGLWLARRDPGARPAVLAALVLQPLVWFGPVLLGSGHLGASVTRAVHPRANSRAFAHDPFTAEFDAALRSVPLRMRIAAAALGLAAAGVLVHVGRRRGRRGLAEPDARAVAVPLLVGLGGIAWFAIIALMTEIGFSGNGRYLVLGAAGLDVCAGVAVGWLALALGRWGARAGVSEARATTAAIALTAAGILFTPGWIGGELLSLPRLHGALAYQARLRSDLTRTIAAAGGPRRVLACGTVMTEGFQVPMVAYALGVSTPRVQAPPTDRRHPGRAPNLVLQTRDTRASRELPKLRWWPHTPYVRQPGRGPFLLYTHCAAT